MAKILTTELKAIPNYTSISKLKKIQNIPEDRDIIEVLPSGVKRKSTLDKTHPQGIYVDVPRYIRGVRNIARMMQEIGLLRILLPDEINIITNHPDYSFVLLENYPLGKKYNPSSSHVLIRIPPEYPQIPPGLSRIYGIYLIGGLKRNGEPLQCRKDQYHWDCSHNLVSMREKGWAWWCFARLENWDPYKDNLFKITVLLAETLQNPQRQRFG